MTTRTHFKQTKFFERLCMCESQIHYQFTVSLGFIHIPDVVEYLHIILLLIIPQAHDSNSTSQTGLSSLNSSNISLLTPPFSLSACPKREKMSPYLVCTTTLLFSLLLRSMAQECLYNETMCACSFGSSEGSWYV